MVGNYDLPYVSDHQHSGLLVKMRVVLQFAMDGLEDSFSIPTAKLTPGETDWLSTLADATVALCANLDLTLV